MGRLPKLYLLLSSFCFFTCLVSCRISKYQHLQRTTKQVATEQNLTPVVNSNGISSKYKASIDVLNKHFSGIVVVKKTDSITTHIVFVTELGMKMFDLEQKDTSLNMVYVFEPLNKPKLISVLKNNLKNMLLLDVFGKDITVGFDKAQRPIYEMLNGADKRYFLLVNNKLLTQATFHKNKKTSKITYVYDDETKYYSQIRSIQYGLVKIKIELNKIIEQ